VANGLSGYWGGRCNFRRAEAVYGGRIALTRSAAEWRMGRRMDYEELVQSVAEVAALPGRLHVPERRKCPKSLGWAQRPYYVT
jgi:hypothetical protein